jgi:2,4-dienoyl-CoA reductase-like NADH-dependent reductase (Old Yellow Enzyme family)
MTEYDHIIQQAIDAATAELQPALTSIARHVAEQFQRAVDDAGRYAQAVPTDELQDEVTWLNQMLGVTGYGQGQIDAHAALAEEVERLRKSNLRLASRLDAVQNTRAHNYIAECRQQQAEIDEIVAGYALVAEHCAEGGFDGIELQCSHSSIVRGFLSPATNHRTDDYSGVF